MTILFIIFENYTKFQCSFHSHQIKQNWYICYKKLYRQIALRVANCSRLRILWKNERLRKSQNCIGTQPSVKFRLRNKFLALVVKKCMKKDIKVFGPCLTLLDFLFFLKLFCKEL